jgi:hypothetical protein
VEEWRLVLVLQTAAVEKVGGKKSRVKDARAVSTGSDVVIAMAPDTRLGMLIVHNENTTVWKVVVPFLTFGHWRGACWQLQMVRILVCMTCTSVMWG